MQLVFLHQHKSYDANQLENPKYFDVIGAKHHYLSINNDEHIPGETYDRLKFPPDTNYNGDVVEKPDCIRQETRHRAKILSHDIKRHLRKKK